MDESPKETPESTDGSVHSAGGRTGVRSAGSTAPPDPALPDALASVTDVVPAPVVVLDADGVVVAANDGFADVVDGERRTVVGEPIGSVCPAISLSAVEAHCDGTGRPDDPFTVHGERADGRAVTLDCRFDRHRGADREWYVGVVEDVTADSTRHRTLEQYERIIETIDDGVYILDDGFDITAVNDAVAEMTGYDRDELVGSNATMLASEETISQATAVSEALLAGDCDAATISTSLETASGETVPVETRFSVYPFSDGSYGQVGVVRDVSERIRYEQTLTALHDATRQLLHAETRADVCERVVGIVTDVIDLSAAVCYLFDSDENVLRPGAAAVDGPVELGDLPPGRSGCGPLWDTFIDEDRRVEHDADPLCVGAAGTVPGESGAYIPLGDHGVFFVAMADGDRVDPDTLTLVDLVAASAEAALGRVDRDERLRRREAELGERNERLGRLKRINEVIRRIDQALVDADSRADVESAVCDELGESPLFSLAWIGRVDGDEVVPEAWAGRGHQYLDSVDRSVDGDHPPPGVRTAVRAEGTVVPSVAADLRDDPWRREAISRDFQSALSVPLGDDVTHGALTVYATEGDVFTENLRSVFEELAETITNAFRVVETKLWLSTERVVEVDVAVEAPESPLVALADEIDAPLDHEGTVPGSDDRSHVFVRVDGVETETVRRAAATIASVESVRSLDSDEADDRYEVTVQAPTVPRTLTEQGCRIESVTVESGAVRVRVQLAANASVRDLVDRLDSAFATASLEGRRDRETEPRSESRFRAATRDRLTDRQWQILRTAYLSGFFEWPRTTTGEEIADTFGVSQPTVNRHLRVGERKLLELLFED